MRPGILMAAGLALAVGGCAATKQEVAENLGSRFVGENVDALVSAFGPPANTFRMNSGETAYVWQLSAVTLIDTDRGSGAAKTNYCKVNVISSPAGIVTKLTTEDGSRGLAGQAFVQNIRSIMFGHCSFE